MLEADVLTAWTALLEEGPLIGGTAVEQFETTFARYCGVSHCISVANGTDALELGLRALGVQPQDEVITVGNAGGYTTAACQAIGATPVYIDVVSSTCQFSAELVEEAVTCKTRAVVVTHLYGMMNDVVDIRDRLLTLQRPDIAILEDCAQAHGARWGSAMAGSLGDAGHSASYPTKNLGAFGDAGAILSSDASIARKARQASTIRLEGKILHHDFGRSQQPHGSNASHRAFARTGAPSREQAAARSSQRLRTALAARLEPGLS